MEGGVWDLLVSCRVLQLNYNGTAYSRFLGLSTLMI